MPMNSYIYIFETCSFLAMMGLMINSKHLLMALLYLEAIMLSLVMAIPLLLVSVTSQSMFISIMLLSVGACEASLGLAMMVMMSRTYGSDLMSSTTMNKC